MLKTLPWLPILFTIKAKVLTMLFKVLYKCPPPLSLEPHLLLLSHHSSAAAILASCSSLNSWVYPCLMVLHALFHPPGMLFPQILHDLFSHLLRVFTYTSQFPNRTFTIHLSSYIFPNIFLLFNTLYILLNYFANFLSSPLKCKYHMYCAFAFCLLLYFQH